MRLVQCITCARKKVQKNYTPTKLIKIFEKLTVVQTDEIVKMITRTTTDANVVPLRYRIFLRYDALFCLLVVFDATAKVLFCPQAKSLTLVEGQICVYVHFKGTA